MHVGELTIYPMKSTRGHDLREARVEPWGLADDRRWMVVDTDGVFVTAREHPALLGVTATPLGPGRLRLEGPHAAPLEVTADPTTPRPVRIRRNEVDVAFAPDAADWLGALLERDLRLAWLADPTQRTTNPERSRPDDRVSFADAYPLLVTSTASLRQLNEWVAENAVERGDVPDEPLSMRRFRPNVVVEHDEPFAEDRWRRLRIGEVSFRAVKLCDRCVMTTYDPTTLVKGREPIRTLARHRRWDGKVWFGVNVIPDGPGSVGVDDPVEILPG